jgi:hypothetical protein
MYNHLKLFKIFNFNFVKMCFIDKAPCYVFALNYSVIEYFHYMNTMRRNTQIIMVEISERRFDNAKDIVSST